MITGKDLIALGYIPNKLFGDAIKYIWRYFILLWFDR